MTPIKKKVIKKPFTGNRSRDSSRSPQRPISLKRGGGTGGAHRSVSPAKRNISPDNSTSRTPNNFIKKKPLINPKKTEETDGTRNDDNPTRKPGRVILEPIKQSQQKHRGPWENDALTKNTSVNPNTEETGSAKRDNSPTRKPGRVMLEPLEEVINGQSQEKPEGPWKLRVLKRVNVDTSDEGNVLRDDVQRKEGDNYNHPNEPEDESSRLNPKKKNVGYGTSNSADESNLDVGRQPKVAIKPNYEQNLEDDPDLVKVDMNEGSEREVFQRGRKKSAVESEEIPEDEVNDMYGEPPSEAMVDEQPGKARNPRLHGEENDDADEDMAILKNTNIDENIEYENDAEEEEAEEENRKGEEEEKENKDEFPNAEAGDEPGVVTKKKKPKPAEQEGPKDHEEAPEKLLQEESESASKQNPVPEVEKLKLGNDAIAKILKAVAKATVDGGQGELILDKDTTKDIEAAAQKRIQSKWPGRILTTFKIISSFGKIFLIFAPGVEGITDPVENEWTDQLELAEVGAAINNVHKKIKLGRDPGTYPGWMEFVMLFVKQEGSVPLEQEQEQQQEQEQEPQPKTPAYSLIREDIALAKKLRRKPKSDRTADEQKLVERMAEHLEPNLSDEEDYYLRKIVSKKPESERTGEEKRALAALREKQMAMKDADKLRGKRRARPTVPDTKHWMEAEEMQTRAGWTAQDRMRHVKANGKEHTPEAEREAYRVLARQMTSGAGGYANTLYSDAPVEIKEDSDRRDFIDRVADVIKVETEKLEAIEEAAKLKQAAPGKGKTWFGGTKNPSMSPAT